MTAAQELSIDPYFYQTLATVIFSFQVADRDHDDHLEDLALLYVAGPISPPTSVGHRHPLVISFGIVCRGSSK
jgi:hypothetical protein